MKELLKNIVDHTYPLGIDKMKIKEDKGDTIVHTMTHDRQVFLYAQIKNPPQDFTKQDFGFGNLQILNGILNFKNYDSESKIAIKYENSVADGFEFSDNNKNSDYFRFMDNDALENFIASKDDDGKPIGSRFKCDEGWSVDFEPSLLKINELSQVSSIYGSIEPNFNVKTNNNNLEFDAGSDNIGLSAVRIFAENINTDSNIQATYPLNTVLNILKLGLNDDSMRMRIYTERSPVMQITSENTLCYYEYTIIPII